MLQYLAHQWPQIVLFGGLLVAYVIGRAWWIGAIKLPVWGGGNKLDDAGDFAALAKLRKRFETANCAEGIAACDTCLTHFFHGTEHHG